MKNASLSAGLEQAQVDINLGKIGSRYQQNYYIPGKDLINYLHFCPIFYNIRNNY
ncbi:hypothetical protein Dacet_2000 [Denitrovibrio acetiphilus DSM 12809]|uniref:Uncharacterized protein n=1 Tax=Denitrovibrio acetiphilus (strain DSM 12809 / NBRC 114555 / N2460) TaxID=522772 RepID=D4H1K3_DENA2|nr:hypothetical protein Dacet_2000 [Denitrovibrio acetiphilus DSM 12809]